MTELRKVTVNGYEAGDASIDLTWSESEGDDLAGRVLLHQDWEIEVERVPFAALSGESLKDVEFEGETDGGILSGRAHLIDISTFPGRPTKFIFRGHSALQLRAHPIVEA